MSFRRPLITVSLVLLSLSWSRSAAAQASTPATQPASTLAAEISRLTVAVEPELIAWRRHLHQNPELGNREVETAKFIVERLKGFGLEPQTGVAKTGVVALLKGGRPGPVVALRADMDALPVREQSDLPFASKATTEWEGQQVGVMHACGHDTHVAMLLATARVLSQMKDRLPGSVKFIFQPAEENVPVAERPAGAQAMIKAGVMQNPKVDAVFGLHVFANVPTGRITYRSGPFMAAADVFEIIVTGRQAHGSSPWRGVDPIVVGAQIVTALQTIVSRNVDITRLPAIVTVGQFQSGVRNNIIPESARLVGTIRTFDDDVQNDIHRRVKAIAEGIASGAGATVKVTIDRGYPVTANDPQLTAKMLASLERAAPGMVKESELITGAEDFTYFQREAPGLFVFLGITPPDQVGKAPSNHSPLFFVDEKALINGVRALSHLAVDFLSSAAR
ncbi:MAG TPA: amidohydrolase [Vicinamibacterales bacterium]|nr:amidohydrolase [Vicinamibacterales bacterium]